MDGLQQIKVKMTKCEKIYAGMILELAVAQVPRVMKGSSTFISIWSMVISIQKRLGRPAADDNQIIIYGHNWNLHFSLVNRISA